MTQAFLLQNKAFAKNNSGLSNISIWICCIGCIASLRPWVTWSIKYFVTIAMLLFVCLRILQLKPKYSYATILSICGIAVFTGTHLQLFRIPILTSFVDIATLIVPLLFFTLLEPQEKQIFLKRTINIFSIILLVSLVFFPLHFFVDLPHTTLRARNDFYSLFENYYFFLKIPKNSDWLTRFQSVFTEPGHTGMTCAILLYINGYSLRKWQNIIMTIALIWTFSLAGYMLYIVGIIFYMVAVSNNLIITLSKIAISMGILLIFGMRYYSSTNDSILSILILSRLEADDSKGISGNNRNTLTFNDFYFDMMQTNQKYFGINRKGLNERFGETGNSSYKNYIVGNGLVGLFNILFLMLIFLYSYPSRKGLGLMLLMCVSFIQRPYFLWHIQVLPYMAALNGWYHFQLDKKRNQY